MNGPRYRMNASAPRNTDFNNLAGRVSIDPPDPSPTGNLPPSLLGKSSKELPDSPFASLAGRLAGGVR